MWRWLDSYKLTLNSSKSNYTAFSLTFANRPHLNELDIENFDSSVAEVGSIKYLGIRVDKHKYIYQD